MPETPQSFLLGIDTGGTYTDAAVIAAGSHEVVASAKALTTRGDLAIGVRQAMGEAVAKLPRGLAPPAISLVSVSTTLATNAVVEGHGSRVGCVLVGFDQTMIARCGITAAFPQMPVSVISGGHDHNGEEKSPLDEATLARAIDEHGMKVEAFAVAAQFAVRNPAHEIRARDIITGRTGKPVTVSSELSAALDAPRRALTATLNARLIGRIADLIDAVRRSMAEHGIDCPLMIVRGDGTLALAETVARRPIETVLSGPAASIIGARWLSGRHSFIMSDMGGTTTDVGVLENGRPQLAEQGADVGGWRTMVKAIDVRTVGLGGDSEVVIRSDGSLSVGPQRIVPVSLLAARFPEIEIILDAQLAHPEITSLAGRFILLPLGGAGRAPAGELSQREADVFSRVTEAPKALAKVAVSAGAERAVSALRRRGLIQLSGFTPSDAAHVLNLQSNWSGAAAEKAAALAARFADMRMPSGDRTREFAREVWSETVRLSARVVLDAALATAMRPGAGGEAIIDAVCRGKHEHGLARIAISPRVPVVAVGAPVQVYYREVARRLDCEVLFPEHCEVANAVGAATGVVARSITVEVASEGPGAFRVYGPHGTLVFAAPQPALAEAREIAAALARAAAVAMGAEEPEVLVRIDKHLLPDAAGDDGLFAASVTAEAIGRPVTTKAARMGEPADRLAASPAAKSPVTKSSPPALVSERLTQPGIKD
jgi:N-methylhydantoinase A/oxoprolinase/acetone carboxylase beta subunit